MLREGLGQELASMGPVAPRVVRLDERPTIPALEAESRAVADRAGGIVRSTELAPLVTGRRA
jgi:hypothetical protein